MATLQSAVEIPTSSRAPREIEVPESTAWPLVVALGFALICTGVLTSLSVSALGVVLVFAGCHGWFREVLPHEHEVAVAVVPDNTAVVTERHVVDRLAVAPDQVRAWLPLRTHPLSAGLKGGLGGAAAMALLACLYGVLKAGSVWYPINLLAACVYAQTLKLGPSSLYAFHADSFLIALGLHALISTVVGLLYGAMLPMFARRPILLGGLAGPVLWSALLYSILSLLNPLLDAHVDWLWFVASQVAFGIVAGLVVVRQPRVTTTENIAFAIRAGVEAPGIMSPRSNGEERS